MIALGALGDHGHHVQGHVVGAHRTVGELKLHKVMVEQNAQDPQMKPDHATHKAAQLQVSKMSVELGQTPHERCLLILCVVLFLQSCMSCVAVVTLTAPVEVAKTVGAAIPPAVVLLVQHNLYLYLATRAGIALGQE